MTKVISIRIEDDLYQALQESADKQGTSVSDYCRDLISEQGQQGEATLTEMAASIQSIEDILSSRSSAKALLDQIHLLTAQIYALFVLQIRHSRGEEHVRSLVSEAKQTAASIVKSQPVKTEDTR